MSGWVKVYRDELNSWLFHDSDYWKAWCEIKVRARYCLEPKTDTYEGILYTLDYGEFIFGRISWSNRLNIGERKLRTFIDKLLKAGIIELRRKYAKFTVYFIVDYGKYDQQNDQQNDQQQSQRTQAFQDNCVQHGDHHKDQHPSSTRPAPDQHPTTKEESNRTYIKDKRILEEGGNNERHFADRTASGPKHTPSYEPQEQWAREWANKGL